MKRFVLCLAVLAVPALAKGTAPVQTHHCVKDGATIEKTKKECKKEGGTWEKNAPAAAKTDAPAPAPAEGDAPAPTK